MQTIRSRSSTCCRRPRRKNLRSGRVAGAAEHTSSDPRPSDDAAAGDTGRVRTTAACTNRADSRDDDCAEGHRFARSSPEPPSPPEPEPTQAVAVETLPILVEEPTSGEALSAPRAVAPRVLDPDRPRLEVDIIVDDTLDDSPLAFEANVPQLTDGLSPDTHHRAPPPLPPMRPPPSTPSPRGSSAPTRKHPRRDDALF